MSQNVNEFIEAYIASWQTATSKIAEVLRREERERTFVIVRSMIERQCPESEARRDVFKKLADLLEVTPC